MGVVERDQISDIRPLKKNQISDITRSQKSDICLKKSDIRYQTKKKQLSDITPLKIRYQGTPVPPPPPQYNYPRSSYDFWFENNICDRLQC